MYVIEVAPLTRGNQIESLTYYAKDSYPIGSMLTVPVRNKLIPALVIDAKPVSVAKTALRAATFSLKKLSSQTNFTILPERIIKTAESLADIYPATVGAILFAMLPPDIRNGTSQYPTVSIERPTTDFDKTPSIITGTRSDRYINYRQLIRKAFVHKGSILFVVPTSAHVQRAKQELEAGIVKRVITFSSSDTKRVRIESYTRLQDRAESKLIIVTPNFALIDRNDITHIILDESGSQFYLQRHRPYLDIKTVISLYAQISKRNLCIGDMVIHTEDEYARRQEEFSTYEEATQRLHFTTPLTIVERKENDATKRTYQILCPETAEMIETTCQQKGHVFLFAARRGLAPTIFCSDCGHLFRCPESGAPLSLIRTGTAENEKRWFVSGTSGKKMRASDTCPQCGSWRLREQGIGIQSVADEVQKRFPKNALYIFDRQTITTHKKALEVMRTFQHTKGGIMVGTNMAIPYLPYSVDLLAITSYEAARAIYTWRADESLMSLILNLRERATREVVIQTQSAIDPVLQYAAKGSLEAFYTDELSIRKQLQYPPYCIFILISMLGTAEEVMSYEALIDATLTDYSVTYYNAPLPVHNKFLHHGLLRISKEAWPDKKLMRLLESLPPHMKIEVNPDRIV